MRAVTAKGNPPVMLSSRVPVIAVSPNAFPAEDRNFYKLKALEYGEASMAGCVRLAGGIPMMAYRAQTESTEEMRNHAKMIMAACDGLLLTGGADVAPSNYGEAAEEEAWAGDPVRDAWEISLYSAAREGGKPVLGVCRGMQLINVAQGGSLWQDLVRHRPDSEIHRSQEQYCSLAHGLKVLPGSIVDTLFETDPHHVNSIHHQGVKRLGADLEAIAWSPDGVVEAIWATIGSWTLGVQWHPEWMAGQPAQSRFFTRFIDETRAAQEGSS
jgi:putative glutamine amidotransferase